ncbi:chromate transporter [Paludibacterium sp.]|uniref:chromate transporter n=1 Tax=Paludibacterium sp. TaxID=1917523 RepID=UPI0025CD1752|nr:chromate transporter [Paludibacterium sp.]MBV8647002.1 chromate transporter [Paludibacterium sp.]
MNSQYDLLATLASLFGRLSLLSFGGVITVLPELQREVVGVHHWLTAQQFAALYALCRAAPGPNVLFLPMIGWRVAGLPGLLVCAVMTYGPPTLLAALTLKVWHHYRAHPGRKLIQSGLVPVTAGLVAASAALLTDSTAVTWPLAAIVALSALLALSTRLSPLWILLGGALLGLVLHA